MSQTEARTCPDCNQPVEAGDAFCGSCGRQLASCPNCGHGLKPGATFCSACGTPVGGSTAPATTATVPAASAPAVPPAPASAPAATSESGRPANVAALVAGIAIAVTAFLPWLADPFGGSDVSAFDLPFSVLYDEEAGESAFKVGHIVAALGALIAVSSLKTSARTLRRALGVATVLTAAAFAVYLTRILEGSGASFTDFFAFGAWMAAVAGAFVAARP